jgi:hypothetical protein
MRAESFLAKADHSCKAAIEINGLTSAVSRVAAIRQNGLDLIYGPGPELLFAKGPHASVRRSQSSSSCIAKRFRALKVCSAD